jgi:hypothetical protein
MLKIAGIPLRKAVETRKRSGRDAKKAQTKPVRYLLERVDFESITGNENTNVPLQRTIARFASLLYRLSIESVKQTRKVINLTRWLKWLTVGLLVLTFGLLAFTVHVEQNAKRNRQRDAEKQLSQTKPEIQITVPY